MLHAPRILTAAALSFLAAAPTATAQQAAEKTLIKSFNTNGQQVLAFDLPGSAEVRVWENATVRVQMTIHLANGNHGMLDELMKVGRYNLTAEVTPEQFRVTAPNVLRKITVKGEELKDIVSYVIFVPKDAFASLNGQPAPGGETAAASPKKN